MIYKTPYDFKYSAKFVCDKMNVFAQSKFIPFDQENAIMETSSSAKVKVDKENHSLENLLYVMAGLHSRASSNNPFTIQDWSTVASKCDIDLVSYNGEDKEYVETLQSLRDSGKDVIVSYLNGAKGADPELLSNFSVTDSEGSTQSIYFDNKINQTISYQLVQKFNLDHESKLRFVGETGRDSMLNSDMFVTSSNFITLKNIYKPTNETLSDMIKRRVDLSDIDFDDFAPDLNLTCRDISVSGKVKTVTDAEARDFTFTAKYDKPGEHEIQEPVYKISPEDSIIGRLFNIVLGKRVKQFSDGVRYWLNNQSIDVTKPMMLCLDGNGDMHPKRANGFAKQIQDYFCKHTDVSNVNFYSAYYEGYSDEMCKAIYKFLIAEIDAGPDSADNEAGIKALNDYRQELKDGQDKFNYALQRMTELADNSFVRRMINSLKDHISDPSAKIEENAKAIAQRAQSTEVNEKDKSSIAYIQGLLEECGECPPMNNMPKVKEFLANATSVINKKNREISTGGSSEANLYKLYSLNEITNKDAFFKGMTPEQIVNTCDKLKLLGMAVSKANKIENSSMSEKIKSYKTEVEAHNMGMKAIDEMLLRKDDLIKKFSDSFNKIFINEDGARNDLFRAQKLARNINIFGFCYGTQFSHLLCRGLELLAKRNGFSSEETGAILKQVNVLQLSPRTYAMGFDTARARESVYEVKSLNDDIGYEPWMNHNAKYLSRYNQSRPIDSRCRDFCQMIDLTDGDREYMVSRDNTISYNHNRGSHMAAVCNYQMAIGVKDKQTGKIFLSEKNRLATRGFEHYEQAYIHSPKEIMSIDKREKEEAAIARNELIEASKIQDKSPEELIRAEEEKFRDTTLLDNVVRPMYDRSDYRATWWDYTAAKLKSKKCDTICNSDEELVSLNHGVILNEFMQKICKNIIKNSVENSRVSDEMIPVNNNKVYESMCELCDEFNAQYRAVVKEEDDDPVQITFSEELKEVQVDTLPEINTQNNIMCGAPRPQTY